MRTVEKILRLRTPTGIGYAKPLEAAPLSRDGFLLVNYLGPALGGP